MTEPMSRWSAVETIGRGVQEAPALKTGFGWTLALAMVGALGRVVMPILVQQAIDRGFDDRSRCRSTPSRCWRSSASRSS